MAQAKYGASACTVDNKFIYTIGGFIPEKILHLNTVEKYDIKND